MAPNHSQALMTVRFSGTCARWPLQAVPKGRFAMEQECMEQTIPRDVFRSSSCTKYINNIKYAFEIVFGPFHRVAVILEFVASSEEWCDNNAFGYEHDNVSLRGIYVIPPAKGVLPARITT
jgi:hypothetical protein